MGADPSPQPRHNVSVCHRVNYFDRRYKETNMFGCSQSNYDLGAATESNRAEAYRRDAALMQAPRWPSGTPIPHEKTTT